MMTPTLRLAHLEEAEELSRLICEVSEGLVEDLLPTSADLSAAEILEAAFLQRLGIFCVENAVWLEFEGERAGLLFAYPSEKAALDPALLHFLGQERAAQLANVLATDVQNTYWVNTLWVAEKFRRMGAASFLLRGAASWAESAQCTALALHCWSDNKAALAFYEKVGFEKIRDLPAHGALCDKHPLGAQILLCPLPHREGGRHA